jgi:nucleoside phosphorylase
MKTRISVLLITPVEVEYQAVAKRFGLLPEARPHWGGVYRHGGYTGKFHDYELWLTTPGSGVDTIAAELGMLVNSLLPDLVILLGIARGIKDVELGDVVVGTQGHHYESGVHTQDGFSARPLDVQYSPYLVSVAREVGRSETWKEQVLMPANSPVNIADVRVHAGPIAGGNKVIKNEENEVIETIRKSYNATLALEMEATALRFLQKFPQIQHLNLRAISDVSRYEKGMTDKLGFQMAAAAIVAGFARAFLHELALDMLHSKPAEASHQPPAPGNIGQVSHTLTQLRDLVEKAVGENRRKDAIMALMDYDQQHRKGQYRHDLLSLRAEIDQLQRDTLRDTQDHRTLAQTTNRLNLRLLEWLSSFEDL